MHVSVREGRGRQVVRLRPIRLPIYWLGGGLFIAMGLLVLATMCVQTQVSCRPSTAGGIWCVVDRHGWWRDTRTEGWLSRAHLEDRTRGGIMSIREAVLTLGAERVDLRLIAADGDDKAALVGRLDALLAGRDTAAAGYQEDTRLLMGLLGAVLVIAGGVILASIERVRVVLDRERRVISIVGRSGAITRRQTVTAAQVRDVRRHPFTLEDVTSYNVVLHLAGGGEMPVAGAPLFTDASANRLVSALQEFLREAKRRPATRQQPLHQTAE